MNIQIENFKIRAYEICRSTAVELGKLMGQVRDYSVKAIELTSVKLQDPRWACGAVVVSNIVFVHFAAKVVDRADKLLDRLSLSDDKISEKARTFKEIFLVGVFAGLVTTFNVAFARELNPNLSRQVYVAASTASCVSYIFLRLLFTKAPTPINNQTV